MENGCIRVALLILPTLLNHLSIGPAFFSFTSISFTLSLSLSLYLSAVSLSLYLARLTRVVKKFLKVSKFFESFKKFANICIKL